MKTKLSKFVGIAAAASALLAMAGGASAGLSLQVTLTAASCFPIGHPVSRKFEAIVNEINKRGKGIVQIDLKGGAPAIGSPFTLTKKVAKGAYDMVGCTEAYFGNVLPEAPVFRFSQHSYATLRKNGGLAYMEKLLNAKGLHYVARHHDFGPFHLFLSKPITKPDLTGLHLRVAPVYTAFFKSLGATVQTSTGSQIYTYMENGTVQGYGWPALGWNPAWMKVTKYRVEPGFYSATLHTLVNLKKWKSLTQKQRDFVTKIGLEFEARSEPDSAEMAAAGKKQKAWTASKGMKTITFTGADRKKWLKAAVEEGWKEVVERSPIHGPKLKALFAK